MPPTTRQVYRRRRAAVFGGAALVLATGFYLPLTLLAPLQPVSAAVAAWQPPTTELPPVGFPAYGAAAVGAIGYDGVLESQGSTTQLPIASITKVVTALTVLDAKPIAVGEPGPEITFTDADVTFHDDQLAQDAIVGPVTPGKTITEHDLLEVMLMISANNYADTVAVWAFGSLDAFVVAAHDWLAKVGLSQTTITDPSGILPSNTSTTADLVELAKLAIADPVVARIVSTVTVDVPDVGPIANRNELVGVDGVNGIKTGSLDEAGACLLFSAVETVDSRPVTIVGVVLGGPDHPTVAADVRGLLDRVTTGFHTVQLAAKGAVYASYSTDWGDVATAVAAKDASILLWSATPVTLAVRADELRLAAAGTRAGTLTFTAGSQTVSVPLEVNGEIDDPGPGWRLTHPTELF